MRTREEMIELGYPEDWASKCSNCGSWNCHAYKDKIICFDCCKREEVKNDSNT